MEGWDWWEALFRPMLKFVDGGTCSLADGEQMLLNKVQNVYTHVVHT